VKFRCEENKQKIQRNKHHHHVNCSQSKQERRKTFAMFDQRTSFCFKKKLGGG
jgi:hypothetical protein